MLRNVLDAYLERIPTERAFDAPFQSLLGAMGFYEIHLTHGHNEMGKDFIAKWNNGNEVQQWSFQLKRGDVSLTQWRDSILGQMMTCELTGLQHPNFDSSLTRQSVLVTTGRVGEHANNEINSFSKETLSPQNRKPIIVWSRTTLVDHIVGYGLGGLQSTLASESDRFGPFYILLGRSISGELILEDLELYSRNWLSTDPKPEQILLAGCIEAAVLSEQCRSTMGEYEAMYVELAALRTLCWHWYRNGDSSKDDYFAQLLASHKKRLLESCLLYANKALEAKRGQGGRLDRTLQSTALIITYPVICMRLFEALSLSFFLSEDPDLRQEMADGIEELVGSEPGATHPVSDRYAVSLVLALLVLHFAGRSNTAKKLLTNTAIFVCDRYEGGFGLGSVDATLDESVQQLLGYHFEVFDLQKESSSFLATALSDAAAFLGDAQLYSDIVNDFKACRMNPQYWQCKDTQGQFELDSEDVIQYPSIEFKDELSAFENFDYAQHIKYEPRSFSLFGKTGFAAYAGVALLLRDRYFPSLWARWTMLDEQTAR